MNLNEIFFCSDKLTAQNIRLWEKYMDLKANCKVLQAAILKFNRTSPENH